MANQGSDSHGREEEQALAESRHSGLEDQEVRPTDEEPDVVLDIPKLNVEEINLEVEDLRAHVSARAELADFVKINVGVDAYLNHLKLEIKGVEAQVALKVRLERILGTIERALSAIERNPGLLNSQAQRTGHGDRENERAGERTGEAAEKTQRTERGIADRAEHALELEKGGEAANGEGSEVRVTDAAWRKAEELEVDLSVIEGTGLGGRILVKDVEKAARTRSD